jgi:hypothetical protein
MAYTTITFEHPETSAIRVAPVGFSWTVLFFGFIPAFIRGDWKYGFIMFAAAFLSFGWAILIFMFFYNRLYIEDLVAKGYLVVETPYPDIEHLARKLRVNLRMAAEPATAQPRPQPSQPTAPPEPAGPRQRSNVPRVTLPAEEQPATGEEALDANPDEDGQPQRKLAD